MLVDMEKSIPQIAGRLLHAKLPSFAQPTIALPFFPSNLSHLCCVGQWHKRKHTQVRENWSNSNRLMVESLSIMKTTFITNILIFLDTERHSEQDQWLILSTTYHVSND